MKLILPLKGENINITFAVVHQFIQNVPITSRVIPKMYSAD